MFIQNVGGGNEAFDDVLMIVMVDQWLLTRLVNCRG
jgi:hypothetical protein